MTKLTDAELAEKVAQALGWTWEMNPFTTVYPYQYGWMDHNGGWHSKFDPCTDWNDVAIAAKALGENEKSALSERLKTFFENTYFDDLSPRKATEFVLEAKGVEV